MTRQSETLWLKLWLSRKRIEGQGRGFRASSLRPVYLHFSQTGLRFPFVFFSDSQLILSWSIPMRSFTRAVVVTRWAEN